MTSIWYTTEFRAEAIRQQGAGLIVPGVACI